jgi:glyoxylase I family protein
VNFQVEHIGLAAESPAALAEWCRVMLNAELIFTGSKLTPPFFVRLPGGLLVEIYACDSRIDETGNNRLAGWRHLALRVDSIEDARDHLSRRGVEFEPLIKPAGGGGRVLFFKDPEGNLWHLVERPEQSLFS